MFKKIAIVGVGLIGGSLGKALIKRGIAEEVFGLCRSDESLKRALDTGCVTNGAVNDYAQAVKDADIFVLATPAKTIVSMMQAIAKVSDKNLIVTDAGSTKKEIVEAADKFSDKFTFIGSHPIAGSEKAGCLHADEDLFDGSVTILTPTGDSLGTADLRPLQIVSKLWTSVGSRILEMTPDEHDRSLAFASHLPHAAAFALALMIGKEINKEISGGGLRDTTRIAASDPVMWSDIFLTNKESVMVSIERFEENLDEIKRCIELSDSEKLKTILTEAKERRLEL